MIKGSPKISGGDMLENIKFYLESHDFCFDKIFSTGQGQMLNSDLVPICPGHRRSQTVTQRERKDSANNPVTPLQTQASGQLSPESEASVPLCTI